MTEPLRAIRTLRPTGILNLVAINPQDGKIAGITAPINDESLDAFVHRHNGTSNLYWMPNEPRADSANSKLTKDDVDTIHFVYLDLDANEHRTIEQCRDAIDALPVEPTLITFSGGGLQAFWQFTKPQPNDQRVQAYAENLGRGIATTYQGDAVQNVDRIMRLPCTLNIPDAKKQARGRVPIESYVVALNEARTFTGKYLIDNLAKPVLPPETVSASDISPNAAYAHFKECRALLAKAITGDPHLEAIWQGKTTYQSGSEADFAVVSRLSNAHHIKDELTLACAVVKFEHGSQSTKTDARQLGRVVHRGMHAQPKGLTVNGVSIIQPLEEMPQLPKPEPDIHNPFEVEAKPPEFPVDSLPKPLREAAELFSRQIGVPIAAAAMNVISACAAAIDKNTNAQITASWFVHANLYLLNVGDASSRKTPLNKACLAPHIALDGAAIRAHRADLAEWHRLPRNNRPEKPVPPHQYVVTDATPEAIVQQLSLHNQASMLLYDEPEQLLAFDRYSSGNPIMRSLLKSAYSGGPMKTQRKTSDNSHVEHGLAHVVANIQTRKLRRVDTTELSDDGFLQRFVPVFFPTDQYLTPDRSLAGVKPQAYHDTIYRLTQRHPDHFKLSEAALDEFWDIQQQFHKVAYDNRHQAIAECLGKALELIVRIALVFHLTDGDDFVDSQIGTEAIIAAAKIVTQYTFPAQYHLFELSGLSHAQQLAKRIAGHILANPSKKTLSPGKLNAQLLKKETRESTRDALHLLRDWNWVSETQGARESFYVNPDVHELFKAEAIEAKQHRDDVMLSIFRVAERQR